MKYEKPNMEIEFLTEEDVVRTSWSVDEELDNLF